MNKFEELKYKIETYETMKAVANDYRHYIELIDYEKEHFQVDDIIFRARGDSHKMNLNSYYAPIPYTVIRDGLQSALDKLEAETREMEKELKDWL